jgi:hypothetical protein
MGADSVETDQQGCAGCYAYRVADGVAEGGGDGVPLAEGDAVPLTEGDGDGVRSSPSPPPAPPRE